MSAPALHRDRDAERRVPGEPGIWLVVIGDLLIFGVLFGMFLHYRAEQPELFAASQRELTPAFGFVNTLVLLGSSLAVVAAVNAVRLGRSLAASRALLVAMLLGGTFVALKAVEWTTKAGDGLVPDTNDFFQQYYVFTGLHLLHVLVGLTALLFARRIAAAGARQRQDRALIQGAAVFWHLVDLLWLILFPLVYFVH
ncbi:cytochrome c oxidase subunit 3 [Patulibacter brassicae]|uniref:Cytochrome aa3 subunit 3 n=1 Tax=Patulibacter brassicae TaxID=1705717 RepID=A0ABU4VN46_9ACTN|nr:cytochrome c oxidase subunit 3 [Patulibacter brassicae]MDX8153264.1 cytochrome c oxidase subunit 3 [Patulibacter brassicae]